MNKCMDFMDKNPPTLNRNMIGSPFVNQNGTFNLQFLNNQERGTVWEFTPTQLWQFFVCNFCVGKQAILQVGHYLRDPRLAINTLFVSIAVTYFFFSQQIIYPCQPFLLYKKNQEGTHNLVYHQNFNTTTFLSCDCGYFAQFRFIYLYGPLNVPIFRYIISIDLHIFGTALMTLNQRDFQCKTRMKKLKDGVVLIHLEVLEPCIRTRLLLAPFSSFCVNSFLGIDKKCLSYQVISDFAFLPFGGGPRKCVGDQFALMECTVALTLLLQNFDVELNRWNQLRGQLFIPTKNGMWCRFKKRSNLH